MINTRTAELVYANAPDIAEAAVDLHYRKVPDLATRYGKEGRKKCLEDANYHLAYLAESILSKSPLLFKDYIGWAQQMLEARNIPAKDLLVNLHCIKEALARLLPIENFVVAAKFLNGAFSQLEDKSEKIDSFLEKEGSLKEVATQYLEFLLKGKRQYASQLIMELAASKIPVKEIYLQVFQPAQYEIGRLWQLNKISVAQEHYCTAATQLIMSQLYPEIFSSARNGKKLVATSVSGDLHEVGLRMVADFFEMEGWDTFYLGANTPHESVLKILKEEQADLLIVSATMGYHVRNVDELIKKIRSDIALQHVKIMVGGYPFNISPDLWKSIGADGYAKNAAEAMEIASKLLNS